MPWAEARYAGWGRALWAEGELARPESRAALGHVAPGGPGLGNLRSYGDACLKSGGRAVDMTRLDRFLAFDAETGLLRVEAGLTLGEIVRVMAPRGFLPKVLPGTGFATVGGAIGNDVHGKNHHNEGSFGQHVTEFTLINEGGAQRVAPDEALFAATMGGLGQTGVVAEAVLQLKPIPGDIVTVTERRAPDLAQHLQMLERSEARYCVGWIDATAHGARLGRGIVEEADLARGLPPRRGAPKRVPFDAPSAALSAPVVEAFNRLYYARVPAHGRTVVKALGDFFFPLDRIHDWNRLYGKAGFHQFQCVVPTDAAEALREMLKRIARAGLASPLAVLKRMGPGRAGPMSFPMEGWTLAVDFRNRRGAARLIGDLEAMTAQAGGRIYLAKDALATPEPVHAMYPGRADWAALVNRVDPERRYETDLVRRLKLRETT